MKKLICFLLITCLFCGTVVFASEGEAVKTAQTPQEAVGGVTVTAKSAVLMDGITGKILYEKNPHDKMAPASVTKIMTMLLVMEAIENGSLKMTDMVTASANAVSMGGTQIYLEDGEQMTVHDLMKSTAVASANDAAMALAEHVGGSEEGFVMMMNNKAAELGMKDTTFINPTGLDAKGHVTSAYDIALMSKALLQKKGITDFTKIWMDSVRDGKFTLANTNKLVRFYKGCTGLKTGTTDGAGSCVSATATRGDMDLISVVMGCASGKERFNDARRLLDYGFSHFVMYKTAISKNALKPVKVIGGVKPTVTVDTEVLDKIIIPAGKEKKVEENVTIVPDLQAPVVKGQKLGEVALCIDGETLATFPIKAHESIDKMSFVNAFKMLMMKLWCI
ncbi:D-alanyl-D-alanine carboxypeptidase family protein [Paludicola sp. MB14-C6]|uniref:D-alanyl-D-alanine carboxypeptidase family protein n=1 Tax=Paludihabitans sp. MB14-C6 TaxID=3070656 RepID=UPI0027DC8063|nr:D-alanyl-D-alanine carboxypeptidase family protein [Paludicola sp. MB14-C6]WMJ23752.1 D-alanyl-D-alanine carboxypeptidase family protein [Paludicola sp. MB14-C6]